MRFYVLRPDGKTVEVWIRIRVFNLNKDLQLGLDSGDPHRGSHFVLLDYDSFNPKLEFEDLCINYGFKRGLVVLSSQGNFHAISFTPTPWEDYVKILKETSICPQFRKCTIKRGFGALRISEKNGQMPQIVHEVVNREGYNFYAWDHERAYVDVLNKKLNIKGAKK